jgi:Na+-transporting NADH:ubiquinone oxidoreductase subunit NqrF
MLVIRLKGLASGQEWELKAQSQDENLLDFLKSKNIPIASSCNGEGVCKKCVIQNEILTCQISIKEFIVTYPNQAVEVSYL